LVRLASPTRNLRRKKKFCKIVRWLSKKPVWPVELSLAFGEVDLIVRFVKLRPNTFLPQ
jgi:hypothetical protein